MLTRPGSLCLAPEQSLGPTLPPPGPPPQFSCFCQNSDAPLPRCRRPDSEKLQFPAACREGEVLVLPPDFAAEPGARGMALEVRPPSLMQALEAAGGQVRGSIPPGPSLLPP